MKLKNGKKKLNKKTIALVQVKGGNTSENLLKEIMQIIFFVSNKTNY